MAAVSAEWQIGAEIISSHHHLLVFQCGTHRFGLISMRNILSKLEQNEPGRLGVQTGVQYRVSEGRHVEADEHFEKSVESGVVEFWDHQVARAILEKRKADPQWPTWIPVRKEPSTSEVNSPPPLAPKSE
jgi:hypothetical protein